MAIALKIRAATVKAYLYTQVCTINFYPPMVSSRKISVQYFLKEIRFLTEIYTGPRCKFAYSVFMRYFIIYT